jgi:hypothetical protein
MRATRWYVYALVDPRDGVVRYIGATWNPRLRLRHHITSRRMPHPKCAWVTELLALDLEPEMRILETGFSEHRTACERKWVEHYWPSGKLLNKWERYFDRIDKAA